MAELALVSSIIAVIQISRDVITQAYKYGQAVKSAKEDMQRVQAEVHDLEDILGKLKDLARRAEASGRSLTLWPTLVSLQDPTSSLHKCQKELEKLQPGLTPVGFWEKSKARALWPHKQNGIYQILDTIRQQKLHLAEALNIDQTGQVLETAQVVEDTAKLQIAHKDVSQSTEAKVKGLKDDLTIRWLLSTDASINHVAAIDKRMKSTGQWFLESTEYHSWKHDSSSFLWLHGPCTLNSKSIARS
ncbi:MAG: hypothetical protein FRX48_01598 [Lasallia pustulata]|uniref:Fungal N-terminal domain-containing protein n=1 Tax=Lasallia pustulata TaxID=136370 RepID=A0A5M8Q0Z1_9LECA|nr:MAG: hypothetical protein FRX48_01598 [Lasallia pustulata]